MEYGVLFLEVHIHIDCFGLIYCILEVIGHAFFAMLPYFALFVAFGRAFISLSIAHHIDLLN